MKIRPELKELIFELGMAGYSTTDIRTMTGVSRQTQWRIRSKPDWKITSMTHSRLEKITLVESALGIDISKPKKSELFDIVEKKAESKFYKQYRQPVVRKTKILDREFRDLSFSKKEFNKLTLAELKKMVGNKIFYVSATGQHQKGAKEEKIPFYYSSKGKLRPTERDLKDLKNFIRRTSQRAFGNYTRSSVNAIVLTTVEKM